MRVISQSIKNEFRYYEICSKQQALPELDKVNTFGNELPGAARTFSLPTALWAFVSLISVVPN